MHGGLLIKRGTYPRPRACGRTLSCLHDDLAREPISSQKKDDKGLQVVVKRHAQARFRERFFTRLLSRKPNDLRIVVCCILGARLTSSGDHRGGNLFARLNADGWVRCKYSGICGHRAPCFSNSTSKQHFFTSKSTRTPPPFSPTDL